MEENNSNQDSQKSSENSGKIKPSIHDDIEEIKEEKHNSAEPPQDNKHKSNRLDNVSIKKQKDKWTKSHTISAFMLLLTASYLFTTILIFNQTKKSAEAATLAANVSSASFKQAILDKHRADSTDSVKFSLQSKNLQSQIDALNTIAQISEKKLSIDYASSIEFENLIINYDTIKKIATIAFDIYNNGSSIIYIDSAFTSAQIIGTYNWTNTHKDFELFSPHHLKDVISPKERTRGHETDFLKSLSEAHFPPELENRVYKADFPVILTVQIFFRNKFDNIKRVKEVQYTINKEYISVNYTKDYIVR